MEDPANEAAVLQKLEEFLGVEPAVAAEIHKGSLSQWGGCVPNRGVLDQARLEQNVAYSVHRGIIDASMPFDEFAISLDDAANYIKDADLEIVSSPDDGVTDDVIKVGWIGDLTGPTASSQVWHNQGSVAYLECVNEDGGIGGRMYELISEDDQYNTEKAALAFDRLADDEKVLAFTDIGGSGQATALDADITKAGAAVIGSGQTIDVMLANDYQFGTLPHYGDQADIAVGQMASMLGGANNAVVYGISLEVPSGTEFALYVEQSVERAGGTYVATDYVPIGATEISAQIIDLQKAIDEQGVNFISLHGSPGTGLLVTQALSDAGITEIPIVGIHGIAANVIYTDGPADVTDDTYAVHGFLTSNNLTAGAAEMVRCAGLAGYPDSHLNPTFVQGYVSSLVLHVAVGRAARENDGVVTRETVVAALKSAPISTLGLSCTMDFTTSQSTPCGAAFQLDPESGGMVSPNKFDFYAEFLDGEYGISE